MLKIAILNESADVTDADIKQMVPAFATQWNRDLVAVWKVEEAEFHFIPKGHAAPADAWWVVFLDNSDQADALAYHDLTRHGLPLSKVFVRTIVEAGSALSVAATHEICEMAVDPWLNSAYQDQRGTFWAGEICDPVEDDQYAYAIDGIKVTDFVTPNWFGHPFAKGAMDFRGHAMRQFEVLSGGYAQKFAATGWVQVTGARSARKPKATPAPGSRRERRARQPDNWARSEPSHRSDPA